MEHLEPGTIFAIKNHGELKYGRVGKNSTENLVLVEAFCGDKSGDAKKIYCKREELTKVPEFHLDSEQLRKLIRYEITFKDIVDVSQEHRAIYIDGEYTATLDDLEAALHNLREKKVNWSEFSEDWFLNIHGDDSLYDAYHFPDIDERQVSPFRRVLPENETDLIQDIISYFVAYTEDDIFNLDEDFQEEFPFDDLFERINRFREDKNKPLSEKLLHHSEKEYIVSSLENEEQYEDLNPEELTLFRKIVDELCEEENTTALKIKAYACYGGNILYPCNWFTSRDCLLKMFELTGDKFAANTLGYIYYYGRCNDNVPQYKEAFKYFSYGAFGLVYESQYKLADMFLHGYGVPKMPEAAQNLYAEVYEDNYKRFIRGEFQCKFADAALRMGNISDLDNDRPWFMRYVYYLQADYAIRKRTSYGYFGDASVFTRIQNALQDARREFHEHEAAVKAIHYSEWWVLMHFTEEGTKSLKASVSELQNGDLRLTIAPAPNPVVWSREKRMLLLTIPEADYCGLLDRIHYHLRGVEKCEIVGGGDSFIYNYMKWDDKREEYQFLRDREVVARIKADDLVWTAPDKKAGESRTYRFAKIEFRPGGHGYDYLCDNESVQAGDHVIVEGYDGETEVIVVSVFERTLDETDMPIERYKAVIRKCD